MLKLKVMGDESRDIWLVEPGVTIGSAAGCELALSTPGIQEKHAEISVSGDSISLKNLCGDTNLLVNGQAAGEEQALNIGDEIAIANLKLMVVDPKADYVPNAAPAATPSPWSIKANHSALNNRVYPIEGKMVLGRSNECDITLSVTHLSRKHAELNVVGGKLVVKDLDSANGTFVNGTRVKEETLRKGDELRLDTLSFTVIGPADDMDKTSVRAVIKPSAKPDAKTEKREAVPKPAAQAKKPAAAQRPRTQPTEAVKPSQPAESSESSGSSLVVPIVIAVVVLIGVAAYFLL